MKTTSFSIETGRGKNKPPNTRYERIYTIRFTSNERYDYHLMLNTYTSPDAGSCSAGTT